MLSGVRREPANQHPATPRGGARHLAGLPPREPKGAFVTEAVPEEVVTRQATRTSAPGMSGRSGSKMLPVPTEVFMGMPVKLSSELVESAREEAANADRSITGQIEHWAKIGRSVETVLRHSEIQTLKRAPLSARLTSGARQAIHAALERVAAEGGR